MMIFPVAILALAAGLPLCERLPESDVRQIFEVPASTPVRTVQAESCTYLWLGPQPTTQQLREALIAGKRPPQRPNESVTLRVESLKSAAKEIDLRYGMLSKGYTVERDGRTLQVKPQNLEWVASVGEKAYWNATLGQIVFSRGTELFSIVVKKPSLSPSDLRNVAETIAQSVLRK